MDLVEGAPLAECGPGQEAEDGDAELHVEVEAGVVEEVRVEIAGPHHLDDAGHDFGLVDADVEGDARTERDEPEEGGDARMTASMKADGRMSLASRHSRSTTDALRRMDVG